MKSDKSPSHWLVKQEPSSYSWETFLKDKKTMWNGVRNYQARNNLRSMRRGDLVLFYRSVENPAVLGLCKVVREHYPDPTATEGDWSVVDLAVVRSLPREVTLAQIKSEPALADIPLLRQSRLSVMPLDVAAFHKILELAGERPTQ